MSENESTHEEIDAFREELREAVESSIFILASGQDEGPFQIDPFSLGLGDQTLAELSPEQKNIVKEELYGLTGINESEKQAVALYHASDDEEIAVEVYEGHADNEEGEEQPIYVHEIKHQDGELDWQISTSVEPLL